MLNLKDLSMSCRTTAPSRSLDRREFIKAGSLAAAGLALPGPLLEAAPSPRALPVLSVGHSAGVPSAGERVRLRSAKDLLTGDPSFISQSARLRIGNFARAARFADAPGGVDLAVVFPSYGFRPEDYPQFRAWRFRHAGGRRSTSHAVSLTVPVTPADGLRMVFLAPQAAADGSQDLSVLALDTGVGSKVMKLQRGVYVVALREADGEREPNWNRHILTCGENGLSLDSPGLFTHLILTVDYAT
jgi:hypothetical protein